MQPVTWVLFQIAKMTILHQESTHRQLLHVNPFRIACACCRQLWRTANIQGAHSALCHKAGLQADKALAARKYAIYTWPSSVQYCRRMKIWSPAHWEHGTIYSRSWHTASALCLRDCCLQRSGEDCCAGAEGVCHFWAAGLFAAVYGSH